MTKTYNASSGKIDFKMTEGDTATLEIHKTTENGGDIDITGWTFWLTAKEDQNDPDSEAAIQKTVTSHTDAVNGRTEFDLTTTDTDNLQGNYHYDMQYKTDTDDVVTFLSGTMYFEPDTTEETT